MIRRLQRVLRALGADRIRDSMSVGGIAKSDVARSHDA
jgi:hypothetical protein